MVHIHQFWLFYKLSCWHQVMVAGSSLIITSSIFHEECRGLDNVQWPLGKYFTIETQHSVLAPRLTHSSHWQLPRHWKFVSALIFVAIFPFFVILACWFSNNHFDEILSLFQRGNLRSRMSAEGWSVEATRYGRGFEIWTFISGQFWVTQSPYLFCNIKIWS